jgi:hypothetical protein
LISTLDDLDQPKPSTLAELRRTILDLLPEAEQGMSHRVPAFKVRGKTVAGFAAFKNHLSYLPHSGFAFCGAPARSGERRDEYKWQHHAVRMGSLIEGVMVVIAGQEVGGWSDDFALAMALAEAASEVALEFFERGVDSTMKDDGTPVTEADLAVEARLVDVLTGARPNDGIVSEEGGHLAGGHRRWILDPIDGTVNFAAGDPNRGTHVALEVNGRVVIGVSTRPVAGEHWWAIRGGGAYRSQAGSGEKVRLQISTVESLAEARGMVGSSTASTSFSAWSVWLSIPTV